MRRVIRRSRLPALGDNELDRDPVAHQLQAVAVAGDDNAVPRRLGADTGDGSDDIVRLPALALKDRDAQRLQNLFHDRHLLGQLLRHRVPGGLVTIVLLMAERRGLEVKGDAERIRRLLRLDPVQDIQKAKNRIRRQPVPGRQGADAVKRPVDDAVAIEDHQFHRRCSFRPQIRRHFAPLGRSVTAMPKALSSSRS